MPNPNTHDILTPQVMLFDCNATLKSSDQIWSNKFNVHNENGANGWKQFQNNIPTQAAHVLVRPHHEDLTMPLYRRRMLLLKTLCPCVNLTAEYNNILVMGNHFHFHFHP